MYKHASANLQRRTAQIAHIRPTAYVCEDDVIPTAANMDLRECIEERARLVVEKTRMANELAAAKNTNNHRAITALGMKQQGYDQRLGLLTQRIKQLRRGNIQENFKQAAREVLSEADYRRLIDRYDELQHEADPYI